MESIEVALDSFGINLIPLVKSRLPQGASWDGVARHPETLIMILKDLFGKDGSNTVESMIIENLKARFGEESYARENDLVGLIAEFRQKSVRDVIPPRAVGSNGSEF